MKRILSIVVVLIALIGATQQSQGIKLHVDKSKINPQFTLPELPTTVSPTTNIEPTFNTNSPIAASYNKKIKNKHYQIGLKLNDDMTKWK